MATDAYDQCMGYLERARLKNEDPYAAPELVPRLIDRAFSAMARLATCAGTTQRQIDDILCTIDNLSEQQRPTGGKLISRTTEHAFRQLAAATPVLRTRV